MQIRYTEATAVRDAVRDLVTRKLAFEGPYYDLDAITEEITDAGLATARAWEPWYEGQVARPGEMVCTVATDTDDFWDVVKRHSRDVEEETTFTDERLWDFAMRDADNDPSGGVWR